MYVYRPDHTSLVLNFSYYKRELTHSNTLSGPNIEEPSILNSFDASEASGRRRRDLCSSTHSWPSHARSAVACFSSFFFGGSLGGGSPPSRSIAVKRRAQCFCVGVCVTGPVLFWGSPHHSVVPVNSGVLNPYLSLYRSNLTGSDLLWGVPQPDELLAGHSHHSSPMSPYCYFVLFPEAFHSLGAAPHQPDPPPTPPPALPFLTRKISFPHRSRKSFIYLSPPHLISPSIGRSSQALNLPSPDLSRLLNRRRTSSNVLTLPRRSSQVSPSLGLGLNTLRMGLVSPVNVNFHLSSLIASQPIVLWGLLVSLTNCLKVTGGFTGISTEAVVRRLFYLSFAKSLLCIRLTVGSPASSSSSLSSFFLEKLSSTTSFLRSVFLPNVKWKCPSISTTVLLSCVPVRLGSEDATDFVSTIFRGADWMLMSYLKVTNFQVSDSVGSLASTHSSPTLNSLSLYLRVLVLSYAVRFMFVEFLNSPSYCSLNV